MNTSKPVIVAAQLGAAWAVGAVALPMTWQALLLGAFAAGGMGLLGVMALAGVAVLVYLIVVIAVTRKASVLGATGGRRVLWALLVMGGGAVGWALGWAATDAAMLGVSRNPLLTSLLGGIPFALVAAMFLRGWQFSTAALGLSLVLIGAGVVVLRQESPDELEVRLAVNGVHRETTYVVAIPGYLPTDDRDYGNGLGRSFQPKNPDAVPPDRYIMITAFEQVMRGEQMCGQPTALDSRLTWGSCTVEADGLVYRNNQIEHGYQVPVGHRYVTVVGTPAVDHDLLRAAALSLHRATAGELSNQKQTGEYFAVTVPGYVGQVTGIPPGMIYVPTDHAAGAQSVAISLYVAYAAGDSICFRTTECTPDGAGLTYVRNEDTHGYLVRRDEVNVRVLGGLGVDKMVLRQAALNARPATEEELRRALPPLEPHTLVDRLRQWLRTF
ncbi:hypothetical protein [Microtetraspora malaysiensis]|uniref:hypothetical protein n=1 Tax=Microtetraspora malaysiensis TaxID=161358 RepID=UPI003D8AB6E9